jgi:hypothetical protein
MMSSFKLGLMLVVSAAVLAVPAFAGQAPIYPTYCAPEPSMLAMLASGLGGIVALRHWRKK